MEFIIALTAAIRLRAGYVKSFTTRVSTLTKACADEHAKILRTEKSLENIESRIATVTDYLTKKLKKGTEAHRESSEALKSLKERKSVIEEELDVLWESHRLNTRLLDYAKKSLKTSQRKHEDAKAELREVEEKRLMEEKAARKAERHAKNREYHRQQKALRRQKRMEARATAARMVSHDNVADALEESSRVSADDLPPMALKLAEELEVDINDAGERETLLTLMNEVQVSA